jgi:NADH:ubiquinone oxidoreductase subunit 2 (subunit N)
MRLLFLLAVAGIGTAASAWGLRRGGRAARGGAIAGIVALLVVTAVAFTLRPAHLTSTGQPVTGVFDAHLVTSNYLRLVVGLWGLDSLVTVSLAWLLGGLPRLRGLLPATLAAITGGTVALASADLAVGAAAATATGLAALMILIVADGPAAVATAARELRVTVVAGVLLLGALGVVPIAARLALLATAGTIGPATPGGADVTDAGPVMGLVIIAMALAVALRWGLLPFHIRVSRLADMVPSEALPLLAAWVALPLTVVAFAAIDRLVAPLVLPLGSEQALLVALALVTLVGAAIAAFTHDDVRHAVTYLVIADAGLLLLAIAALDPAAWGPGRAWVVVLAASKTALGGWAAVAEDRFSTRSIPDLRGWVRQSPLLAAGLVLTTLATFGLPGWVAFEARGSLATLAGTGPWEVVLILAGFLTLPTYLRLLGVGLGRPTSHVDRAAPERIARGRREREALPVEADVEAVASAVASDASAAATEAPSVSAPEGGAPATTRGTSGARSRRLAAAGGSVATRLGAAARRDRTELLAATVLAMAILAALTSWGALDIGSAAAEPAPIVAAPGTD